MGGSDSQLLHYQIKCPVFNPKNHKTCKETEQYGSLKEKISQQKICHWAQKTSLLDKDFKTTVSKMLKEPKEDMEKVRKTKHEQNGYINKETRNKFQS